MQKNLLRNSIHILRGLISYHRRMTLPLKPSHDIPCSEQSVCPVLAFEDDAYLSALETALAVLEREYGRIAIGEDDEKRTTRYADAPKD